MTETPTPIPTPEPSSEAPASAPAVALYPEGGGAETVGGQGEATISGTASEPGASTEGGDTLAADTAAAEGQDSLSSEGADSLSAESFKDLKLPETLKVDDAVMGQFKELALAEGLKPEAAQKILDLLPQVLANQASAAQTVFDETQERWRTEIKAMPEFATDISTTASLRTISKVLDEFGSPAVRDAFNATGAGNNPDIVKFMLNVSKALSEGRQSPTGRPATPPDKRSAAERFYPNTNKA